MNELSLKFKAGEVLLNNHTLAQLYVSFRINYIKLTIYNRFEITSAKINGLAISQTESLLLWVPVISVTGAPNYCFQWNICSKK